jgi:hypothetical protein
VHEALGGAFPKRHHVDYGVFAIICKVPVLGRYTYLVHMLEARFVNPNPFVQQMFLKLHDIEDSKILFWRLCVENLEMLLL